MTKPIVREWDRRDNEDEEEYRLFKSYLELRSKEAVAESLYPGLNSVIVMAKLDVADRKHNWEARTIAYDRFIAKNRDKAVVSVMQHEIKLVGERIIRSLSIVSEKVQQNSEAAEAEKTKSVVDAVRLIDRLNDLYEKIKSTNPAIMAGANADDAVGEVRGARAKLMDDLRKVKERDVAMTEPPLVQ